MKCRSIVLVVTATAVVVVSLATVAAAASNGKGEAAQARPAAATTWSPPRTPDGRPDLQGVWTFKTVTPLERPRELAGKEFFTEEEAIKFEQQQVRAENRDLIDPTKGGLNYAPESQGGVVPYNEFWYDRGTKVVASRRTSLIVDPADGRLPPMTPEAQKKAEARSARGREEQRGSPVADNPEDRSVGDRCLMGFNAGPPMTPGGYNQNLRIFQNRDHVVILNEMIHTARIVPLSGRPHGTIRLWAGDSRGRWEGDTLVVETTNFRSNTSLGGSTPNMHLVERFTRVGPDMINYEFTVTDATTWTRAWTAVLPLTRIEEEIYEYACHEGNYSMVNVLRGARMQEQATGARSRQR